MEIERTSKDPHLDTIRYEIDMLDFCYERLSSKNTGETPADQYVYLEAFLLHYRNLIQFFAGNGHKDGSLSTKDAKTWAGRELTTDERSKLQEPGKILLRNYWDNISIFLQHCTEQRSNKEMIWNIKKMHEEIEPIVHFFRKIFL